MTLTITLPLPAAGLSPNSRLHWAAKSRLVRDYRGAAAIVTRDAMNRAKIKGGWERATVRPVFYKRVNRRADADNALSSLKAAIDGLADAGLIRDDSGLTYLPVEFRVDSRSPRVELVVESQ